MIAPPVEIFISYSLTDKIFVERLVADLAKQQVIAWVGHMNIQVGQYWPDVVEEAIERAQVVLVIWSPKARESKFVKKEYTHALEHDKLIIPLLVKPCKTALLLQGLHWIDFTEANTYTERLGTLLHFLANRDTIPLAPKPPPIPPAPRHPSYVQIIVILFIGVVASLGLLASMHGPKQTTSHAQPTSTVSLTTTPTATAIILTSPVAATAVVGAGGSSGNTPKGGPGAPSTYPVSPPVNAPTTIPTVTPSPTLLSSPTPSPTPSPTFTPTPSPTPRIGQ